MERIKLKKDTILCVEGDHNADLFRLLEGRLLICILRGSAVTPLAYIEKGEFIGELSFFDEKPRSASIIALEDSLIDCFSRDAVTLLPPWLITLSKSLTKKIRDIDALIATKGIRKKSATSIKPLSMEEQRHYYLLLKDKG